MPWFKFDSGFLNFDGESFHSEDFVATARAFRSQDLSNKSGPWVRPGLVGKRDVEVSRNSFVFE